MHSAHHQRERPVLNPASISMRTDQGIAFGTAGHIAITMLVVKSPGVLEQDQEIEFQLELPGLQETVYGSAVVHHLELHEDEPNHYELRIQRLRAGDEILLREWVANMRDGGSSVHPHLHLKESDISTTPSDARTVDDDEPHIGAISTWDARRAAGAGPAGRGRSSLRQGLRRHLERMDEPLVELVDEPQAEEDEVVIEITEP
jgi:hypothetical protein